MRPTTVTIYDQDGTDVVVQAFTTAAPGLVVHVSNGDPGWVVTHERSGLLVMMFENPEQAQAAAGDLALLADWTLDGHAIMCTPHIELKVASVRSKWGGETWLMNDNPDAYADRLSA